MLERTIKDAVKKRLKALGAYQLWPVQMGLGETTVDCLACYKGQFFGIECKAPGESPTLKQNITLRQIQNAGGRILVIDRLEQIDEFLTADTLSR